MKEFDVLRERVVSNLDYDIYKYLSPYLEAVEKRIKELEEIEFKYNDLEF